MQNRYTVLAAFLSALVVGSLVGCTSGPLAWAYPGYKVTILVVDESGAPVEGAQAWVSFSRLRTFNPWDGQDSHAVEGLTNAKGERVLRGRGIPQVGVGAEKEGYYPSWKNHIFGLDRSEKKDDRAVTMELRLRKKIAPTAMYARRVRAYLPVIGEPVGYDLLAGDWVAPYGRGSISDFTIVGTLNYRKEDDFDATLVLRFPNKGDGMAAVPQTQVMEESELLLPHEAPEAEYDVNELQWTHTAPQDQYVPKCSATGKDWYLRLRTQMDREGRVAKAMYGKIAGPIVAKVSTPGPKLFIGLFTYYVNPDGTRNIEFDPTRNLIPNARDYEKPVAP